MLNPFETLGLPPRYDLDMKAAEKAHRELSRALHPDRYAGAGASERRDALAKAADVNEAWRIVRDPVRRAEALIALAGVAVGDDKEPKPDPELLMDVLDKREALADAKAAHDLAKVRALADEMEARKAKAEDVLARELGEGGSARAALPKLGELRFFRRFLEEASAIEEELTG
jgi:molecular chaperone HscB